MGCAEVSKPEQTPLRGLHVLVVEDHDDSRFVVEASLRYCGALVTAVRSASEGLAVVRKAVATTSAPSDFSSSAKASRMSSASSTSSMRVARSDGKTDARGRRLSPPRP
jgi:CheY-like chemotaxis protein